MIVLVLSFAFMTAGKFLHSVIGLSRYIHRLLTPLRSWRQAAAVKVGLCRPRRRFFRASAKVSHNGLCHRTPNTYTRLLVEAKLLLLSFARNICALPLRSFATMPSMIFLSQSRPTLLLFLRLPSFVGLCWPFSNQGLPYEAEIKSVSMLSWMTCLNLSLRLWQLHGIRGEALTTPGPSSRSAAAWLVTMTATPTTL